MILPETIKKAEESRAFREWHKANPDFYLAHAFTMLDEHEKKYNWELGYYSPSKDRLVVVETQPDVSIKAEEEVFKKDGPVKPLGLKSAKVSVARAMEICDGLLKEKYSAQAITKRIILMQNLDRQMYNVTLVTMSFSILNIRIDAQSGELISHNLQSIMNLGSWEKGGAAAQKEIDDKENDAK